MAKLVSAGSVSSRGVLVLLLPSRWTLDSTCFLQGYASTRGDQRVDKFNHWWNLRLPVLSHRGHHPCKKQAETEPKVNLLVNTRTREDTERVNTSLANRSDVGNNL